MAPILNRNRSNSERLSHGVQSGRINHRSIPSRLPLTDTDSARNNCRPSHAQALDNLSSHLSTTSLCPKARVNGPTNPAIYQRHKIQALGLLLTSRDCVTKIRGRDYHMEDIRNNYSHLLGERQPGVPRSGEPSDMLIYALNGNIQLENPLHREIRQQQTSALQDLVDVVDGRKVLSDPQLETYSAALQRRHALNCMPISHLSADGDTKITTTNRLDPPVGEDRTLGALGPMEAALHLEDDLGHVSPHQDRFAPSKSEQ